jgi:chromosome partitioning protein
MLTLTVINRKGGVSKSTTVLNLGAEFAARGLRVLLVDTDPQSTLTVGVGIDIDSLQPEQTVMASLLPREMKLSDRPQPHPVDFGVDILPATPHLVDAETLLMQASAAPLRRLHQALAEFDDRYDIVVVDTPPSLGRLSLNALSAADRLLIPLNADVYSAGGLKLLLDTVEDVRAYERPELAILGAFAAQVRNTLHARATIRALERSFGDLWIPVGIPQTVAVQNSQAECLPLRDYDRHSKAANAYRRLADVILGRLRAQGLLAEELSEAVNG